MGTKVGVYVDVANISLCGGKGMRFAVLRQFAARMSAEVMRLNAYATFDERRAKSDDKYRAKTRDFHAILRDYGYKVRIKQTRWYRGEDGIEVPKANTDLDMAVEMLLQSKQLDKIVVLTGDGDFVEVVRAIQNQGCRVEVVAFDNVSRDLIHEADQFISGYMIPDLLPFRPAAWCPEGENKWGEATYRVRGLCYDWQPDRSFGFLRFLKDINGHEWITDTRDDKSPYQSVFVHRAEMAKALDGTRMVVDEDLPARDLVFEFTLAKSQSKEDALEARHVRLVN